MSSTVGYNDCPCCGSKETLYYDFNCKTQEEESFCRQCGYSYSFRYKRDENGKPEREIQVYPKSEVVFSLYEDYDGKNDNLKMIWERKYNDIPNITADQIWDFLNRKSDFGFEEVKVERDPVVINNSLFGDGDPVLMHLPGIAFIEHVVGETRERIFYRLDDFELDDDNIIIKQPISEEKEEMGKGIYYLTDKDGCGQYWNVEATTLEEAQKEFSELLSQNKKIINKKRCFGTWFDNETKKLIYLKV